ncbi:hypothetical protein VMUT_1909 [Vulcanisaeta moutnovskia 768-28]|uniref:Uncharacterized protein n=1 Tax=Vulcanisaeta moutnovskia (strain 768-28) TaxID=985053 RepID=F0QVT6_VULM7|nr:hypothetical protein VMUT_1909 [Vulcanisaeta moutnovskia 768-28]
MSELKYADVSDEEVMRMIMERIREMKQLLSEIRDMLRVE